MTTVQVRSGCVNGRQLIVSERVGEQAGWVAGPCCSWAVETEIECCGTEVIW